jgi:tetratricopeptide (TPR) repeat protein
MAAQRLYHKVTQIAPRYIYGWSNLGNTQVILNTDDFTLAEQSYNTAIHLCQESIEQQQQLYPDGNTFGMKRCSDLYVLLLNRGCLRLNTGQYHDALLDLQQAEQLRGAPDPIILQNLARAYEYNGNYAKADYDYTLAISMSNSNEVNPFWIRSAMVKFQLGSIQSGLDLLKRVLNRFPDAPEVKAAYAVFLLERNPNHEMTIEVQQTFLDIPTRQRLKFRDPEYVTKTICWPPAMIERLNTIIKSVGDDKRTV